MTHYDQRNLRYLLKREVLWRKKYVVNIKRMESFKEKLVKRAGIPNGKREASAVPTT